ncbi:MAG: AAA family ATPase [Chitinophagaceae bacterium]|nr:AAA family ATPase [Chitinophagaceae bacterium]
MQTQLVKFRVQNFRSIIDSGWVDAFENTCLIGTNESGKTNLLVGLWKLNPANGEQIIPLIDYPRKKYVDYAKTNGEEVFVSAHYHLNESSIRLVKTYLKEETVPIRKTENRDLIIPEKLNGELVVTEEVTTAVIEKVKTEVRFTDIVTEEEVSEIIIHRKYNGNFSFLFPK